MKKLVLVEDDYLQAQWLADELREKWPEAKIDVLATELEFRDRIEDFVRDPPDAFVIDVMLRWTDPSPGMTPAPAEIVKEGYFRAGIRCENLLRERRELIKKRVVLYSVLDEGDLQSNMAGLEGRSANTILLTKDSDSSSLIDKLSEPVEF